MTNPPPIDFGQRFWSRVDDTAGANACWTWTGAVKEDGRGRVTIRGRRLYAYRVAWELTNRTQIPAGGIACHACDNPGCVNPGHIEIGDQGMNMRGCRDRGRLRPGVHRGMASRMATVQPDVIAEVVRRHAQGGVTYVALAHELGVWPSTVRRWVIGKCRQDAQDLLEGVA